VGNPIPCRLPQLPSYPVVCNILARLHVQRRYQSHLLRRLSLSQINHDSEHPVTLESCVPQHLDLTWKSRCNNIRLLYFIELHSCPEHQKILGELGNFPRHCSTNCLWDSSLLIFQHLIFSTYKVDHLQ
jgi:hypothetical protein